MFPLLADPKSETIDAYGIRDPDGKGFALPGTYLVDKDGIVRAKLFLKGYKERHSTEDLIEAAKKLAK
jgi:peroxiredoxin